MGFRGSRFLFVLVAKSFVGGGLDHIGSPDIGSGLPGASSFPIPVAVQQLEPLRLSVE
jgi:hypothetical protein